MPNDSFTTSWLAARLGADPARIEARRRSGELFGVPVSGGREHLYPAWQFDSSGEPIPALARVLSAAREAGLEGEALETALNRREGTGGPKMCELIRAGREDYVIAALRSTV